MIALSLSYFFNFKKKQAKKQVTKRSTSFRHQHILTVNCQLSIVHLKDVVAYVITTESKSRNNQTYMSQVKDQHQRKEKAVLFV
jgi:hypothetical protein